jgi:mono/diheme cytochrome c family protein
MTEIKARAVRAASCAMLGVALAGCAAGVSTPTATTDVRSIERGRALYENNCRVCHTAKVHRRVPQLPANEDELRRIVLTWVRYDVVYYVNRAYYQFDK